MQQFFIGFGNNPLTLLVIENYFGYRRLVNMPNSNN